MSELIARVMSRVIEVGNCLEWTGAYSVRVPAIAWKGKQMNVRRALAIDLQLLSGCCANKVAVVCCGNWRCVAPDHVRVITRKKLQQQTANAGHHASQIIANCKRSRSARRRAKLTEKQVAEIREAQGTQRELAKRFGVSQATIFAIKKGNVWRDYTSPFSYFVGVMT